MNHEITAKLCSIAESVKAEILYDLKFNISPNFFFKLKFEKERQDEKRLSQILYK